jgi:hypothetical protein
MVDNTVTLQLGGQYEYSVTQNGAEEGVSSECEERMFCSAKPKSEGPEIQVTMRSRKGNWLAVGIL